MTINRKEYYDAIRPLFGKMSKGQVQGQEVLLTVWEELFWQRTPITQFAYCLGTTYHETAHTMLPIREFGSDEYLRLNYDVTGKNPDRAKRMGNRNPGDGIKYCGRGDVQLTWFVNYDKATKRLKELNLIPKDMDFTVTPDKVMEPRTAALIMFIGMEEGWFTWHKLDELVDPLIDGDEHADAVKARAIINGKDRAEAIADYADSFLAALKVSWHPSLPPAKPIEPDKPQEKKPEEKPLIPPVVVPYQMSWWGRLGKLILGEKV